MLKVSPAAEEQRLWGYTAQMQSRHKRMSITSAETHTCTM